jgi:hypothetical protein
MLQFLDKSTLNYAAVFGIEEDTVRIHSRYSEQRECWLD